MTVLNIFKETALPSELVANSIYLIAPPSNPNYVEVYVTGITADIVKRTINKDDIQAMIDSAAIGGGSASSLLVVADLAARDDLELTENTLVLVEDATGDTTVGAGSALYVFKASAGTFNKIAEYESLDLVLSWANLQDKPSSSTANIDDAVSKRHTHSNKTQLDKIDQDADGNLIYDGKYPLTGLSSVNW